MALPECFVGERLSPVASAPSTLRVRRESSMSLALAGDGVDSTLLPSVLPSNGLNKEEER